MTFAETIALHATVEGRVQGVGFRYFVLNFAQELRLTGWVRNTFSGDVEVWAEGERQKLDVLLVALRQGPRSAFVTTVNYDLKPATQKYHNFAVRMNSEQD